MTMQTLDPFYVDVNIATSAEFQARLTDYVDLVTSFPDETAICNIYRHTDAHSDPITSKIEFFLKNFRKECTRCEEENDFFLHIFKFVWS